MISKNVSKLFGIVLALTLSISSTALAFIPIPMPTPVIPVFDFPPFIGVVTPVPASTSDTTPDFTFSSTEAGTITYSGDCASLTPNAVAGNNTITFKALSLGTHSNCKISVTDGSGNGSDVLDIPSFTIELILIIPPGGFDFGPFLSVKTPVETPTYNTTPELTFNSTQAGTIAYTGDCSSSTTAAIAGDNKVKFNTLAVGVHSNCSLKVTSAKPMTSAALVIPSFEVKSMPVLPPAVALCADFKDVYTSDSDCDAIAYVKSIGAMTGNPDGNFDPNALLQRDQIAKIALESFGKFNKTMDYCTAGAPFGDVTESAWSYQYVCRAKGLGVVTGYASGPDKGFYKPSRNVNRSEFLAIVLRNLSESMPSGSSFNDVDASSWFGGYAKYAKLNSLFVGSNLYPTNFTSRREVAQVIYKLHTLGKI